jgi:hypothetical protein
MTTPDSSYDWRSFGEHVIRSQTQRRLDKELIGKELLDKDYISDADWDQFLSHGAKPAALGAFD